MSSFSFQAWRLLLLLSIYRTALTGAAWKTKTSTVSRFQVIESFSDNPYCQADTVVRSRYSRPSSITAKLRQVIVITREGDRAPWAVLPQDDVVWDQCPTDTMSASSTTSAVLIRRASDSQLFRKRIWQGTCMEGQLTNKGRTQMMNLGSALRRIYVDELHYLPETSSQQILPIMSQSLDKESSIQSAAALLHGVYPSFNRTLLPLHVQSSSVQILTPNPAACPALFRLRQRMKLHPLYQKIIEDAAALAEQAARVTGLYDPLFAIISDTLLARECHEMVDLTDPRSGEHISEAFASEIMEVAEKAMNWTCGTSLFPTLRKLETGPLLRKIGTLLKSASLGQVAEKMYFFAGEELTLFGVLDAMQLYLGRIPYASSMLIELWQDPAGPNGYFVRIFYNGEQLRLPFCFWATECDLTTFMHGITPYILNDGDCD